jgi:hypothetical protein
MWLLLAGRAHYTTGVALQASLLLGDSSAGSSSSSSTERAVGHQDQMFAPEQQQQQAAPDSTASLPQRWLPILKDYIVSLGFTLQQLEASGGAAVQGSKQLRIVLGRAVLEAHTQLVAACAAAVDSTCNSG